MSRDALRLDLQVQARSSHLETASDRDSDKQLVRKAKAGEYSAFELLFERHRALVYRFSYQMTQRRDDAEDIVQEVFVRAYQNLHRYRDEAKFTTWLLRIATNLGTDRGRMIHRRQRLEQQESAGALSWMTVGNTEDPIKNLVREQLKEILRRAISALPDHHRNVIVLRDIEEMDYKDMSATLGCSVGGAKLRVLRARRALQTRVAPLLKEMEETE